MDQPSLMHTHAYIHTYTRIHTYTCTHNHATHPFSPTGMWCKSNGHTHTSLRRSHNSDKTPRAASPVATHKALTPSQRKGWGEEMESSFFSTHKPSRLPMPEEKGTLMGEKCKGGGEASFLHLPPFLSSHPGP